MTTREAAELLGVSTQRIRAMIAAGRLKAKRVGRDWLITRAELSKIGERKPGRPPKV